jgi:hypothetical protein
LTNNCEADDGNGRTTNDDAEKSDIMVEQQQDSLIGFGSASITSAQAEEEDNGEDDNEYYRNQAITEANKRYTPGVTETDNQVQGNGKGKRRGNQQQGKKSKDIRDEKNEDNEKAKRTTYIQKYHDGGLLADLL